MCFATSLSALSRRWSWREVLTMAGQFFKKLMLFGSKHRVKLLAVSCGGLFATNVFCHVFPQRTYGKLYQAWSKGVPAELPDRLQDTFQEVLKDAGVESAQNYTAFAAFSFQPVSAGVPWLPSGALIGIPVNFNSTGEDGQGITNRIVMINGRDIKWDSEVGKSLRESLTFSSNAQKFAIAREVMYLQSNGPVLQSVVAPACLAGTYLTALAAKQALGLYSGPFLLRALFNLAAAATGFVGYFLLSDAVNHWLDYRSDHQTATISKSYAKGGIEFYDKILARNRTFRSLLGKMGMEMYATNGNLFPKHWFRLKHAPYTARKEMLENTLKDC
ncbi:transmembrane protein 177 [Hypanus sabinus]|uniref:transmembrane protein 177 n=1 Tax=Hypanus sabinus TaxID=79690 RepID=UPI0028C4BA38|nr:transmembrane protein 177 [Hypanus sabinus]